MDGRANPLMDRKVVGVSGYLFVYLSEVYLSLSICLSIYLSIHPSIYLSICKYIYIFPSFYLSICLYLSIGLSIYLFIYLSETKQFCETSSRSESSQLQGDEICETSSIFEIANVKFCEASVKNGKLSPELTASYQCVCVSKVLRLLRKSEAKSYEVQHLSRRIILANLKI